MSSSRLPMPWRAFHVTVHTEPPPACALVALTPSSSALRAKTAYEGGGYEFCSHSGIGNGLLHVSMTMQFPIPEYGVNSSRRVMEMHKKFLRCFNSLSYMLS